jgi:putative transcriptional regulator
MRRFAAALILALVPLTVQSQGMFLVARPNLPDPNFHDSVVLAAETEDGGAVGVIINHPTRLSLAGLLPENELFKKFTEPMFFGGPVQRVGIFAVHQGGAKEIQGIAMLPDVKLALHPAAIELLMENPPARLRFYTGYTGWGPGQLRAEIDRGDWAVLDADAQTIFRKDMERLWPELIARSRAVTAASLH